MQFNKDKIRRVIAWVCFGIGLGGAVYTSGYNMWHWADMTQAQILGAIWPQILVTVGFLMVFQILMHQDRGRR